MSDDVLDLGDRILSFAVDVRTATFDVILDDDRVVHLGRRVSARIFEHRMTGTIERYTAREFTTSWGDPTGSAVMSIDIRRDDAPPA